MNDEMAIGAMQTLKSQGFRVPEDVSVTGFDDIPYARYCDPDLTTIAQPAEEMGKMAMDMLIRVINNEPLTQNQFVLPSEFIIRKSTAPLKPDASISCTKTSVGRRRRLPIRRRRAPRD